MSGWRLLSGGLIDRSAPLSFQWAGRKLHGFKGDTLASALLANGISIVGRSFKYHRPRGLLAAGLEEPNAIVQTGSGAATVPNIKATQIELVEGLEAVPVNAHPSVEFDLLAINGLFKQFIPAAFYYKTFMWPAWRWFEPTIRRAAGLGVAPSEPDCDSYAHRNAHVDVLVVGSGAAGLSAALAVSAQGESVMIVEGDRELGGGLLSETGVVEGGSAHAWLSASVARLQDQANVIILTRTIAFGYYDHDLIGLCERLPTGPVRERLWRVRARRVILATGAFEQPLAFECNDLPGIMLASAAKTYAVRHGVAPGRRIVIATNNDSAYAAAVALHDAGVEVVAILDSREDATPASCDAETRSIQVHRGTLPVKATGRRRISKVVAATCRSAKSQTAIACDTLLVSGGWNPAVHLHSQSGGSLRFDDAARAFLPSKGPQHTTSIGAASGIFDLNEAIADARAASLGERRSTPDPKPVGPVLQMVDGEAAAHKAWLDYQNDVTVGDLQLAARENFRSVEHVKRYTTLGMASDQGKTSNVPAIETLSALLAKPPQQVGTTKFRPPFDPVTIGTFAGRNIGENLKPLARLAAHERHLAHAGIAEDYGGWLRPSCYRRPQEREAEAIAREVLAVRSGVGLFEASPLGKIEVKGPDAATFLDRMYVNTVSSLKPGRCRYAIMLSEHGVVYDDGVIARLSKDHFLVGTTSGNAATVAAIFDEWLQCEWPELRVLTEDVTTCWAVMTVAGPKAREVLKRLGSSIELGGAAFGHMSCREGTVGGVRARVQRVSFTGELSFEVSVPWRYGIALWDALIKAGATFEIMPFGVEALMTMRIEKGFLHVGSDTDGTTFPQDIGFGAVAAKKGCDFVGRRSTTAFEGQRRDRRQFVGLEVTDGAGPLAAGAHILPTDRKDGSDGWVTSTTLSPTLRRPLALALVRRGESRLGETVHVWDLGLSRSAVIVEPRFYDPKGTRLDG